MCHEMKLALRLTNNEIEHVRPISDRFGWLLLKIVLCTGYSFNLFTFQWLSMELYRFSKEWHYDFVNFCDVYSHVILFCLGYCLINGILKLITLLIFLNDVKGGRSIYAFVCDD